MASTPFSPGIVDELIGLPLAHQRAADAVEGAALLLPGLHALAVLFPEIGRQLLHAALEQIRVLDGLVAGIILGLDPDDGRLDPQVDVLGYQRDAGLREFSLQRQRVGEDGVVRAVTGQAVGQRGIEKLGLKEQPPGRRAFAVIDLHAGGQREPAVDLLLGGVAHQLVEKAADLTDVAGRLRHAFLAGVELLEHGHRDVDVVLFETEYRRGVVHQDIGVEHEDAPLGFRLGIFRGPRRHRPQGRGHRAGRHRVVTASRTASAWPFTLTLRHSCRSTPLASTTKVLRSTPIYFLPYMLFS